MHLIIPVDGLWYKKVVFHVCKVICNIWHYRKGKICSFVKHVVKCNDFNVVQCQYLTRYELRRSELLNYMSIWYGKCNGFFLGFIHTYSVISHETLFIWTFVCCLKTKTSHFKSSSLCLNSFIENLLKR